MNEAKEQIESLAALIGSTQAELGKLDENIVGESTNLKRNQFDGKPLLKKQIEKSRQEAGVPDPPPPAPPPPSAVHTEPVTPPMAVQPIVQPQPQPVQGYAQPQQTYGSELTVVLQKLISIETEIKELNQRLDAIEYFDKKVVDSLTRGLKNKVKQVTIKLDETNSKQQK